MRRTTRSTANHSQNHSKAVEAVAAPARAESALASDNRRSGNRASIDALANRYMDGHPYLCVALDVSPTGMRLRPLGGPDAGARFMGLQFQLPGSDQVLNASGELVRDSGGEVALRFTHVPQTARAAIERFIEASSASNSKGN